MKKFKMFSNILIALLLMLSLFGCSKSSSNQDTTTQSESADSSTQSSDSKEKEESKTVDPSEYIFPDSDKTLLSEKDLDSLPVKTLELGRNEIFARHGYVFKTEELKNYFQKKSWYKANSSFSQKDLNATETKNISLIKSVQDKKTSKTVTKKVAGKTYGKINQVSIENETKYIVFDKVEWLTYDDIKNRQDVKDYLVKEYGSMPEYFENDYIIYDQDTNLTKLQFSNTGTITNWKYDDNGITTAPVSFDDLKNNTKQNEMLLQDGIYSITTENNIITKLEKMYQP